jgi:hypothetical protein
LVARRDEEADCPALRCATWTWSPVIHGADVAFIGLVQRMVPLIASIHVTDPS